MLNTYTQYIATALISAMLLTSCGNNSNAPSPKPATDTVAANPADALRNKIADYIISKNTNIGVGIMALEDRDTLSVNGNGHYPMMSVCKFPQAITLLHLVDEGKLSKDEPVHITKEDMKQRTNSTLQKDHPKQPFDLTIPEAFAYSIGQSDNVTSNVIFAMEGGPAVVEAYIHSLGITDIGVGTDYWHLTPETYQKNWITPIAAVTLLNKFKTGKILSDSSTAKLWKAMVEAPNGKNRIPGALPAGTTVGHKTGTSGRDTANVTTAFNDIGIIQLPNGKHLAVAVFISNSSMSDDDNAKTIADISKMAWDHYTLSNQGAK